VADAERSFVAELDLSGKVLWEYRFQGTEVILSCQRLPGGNTFIATDEYLTEVTPTGEMVWTYRPESGLFAAYRSGQRVVAVEGRHLVEMTVGGSARRLPTRIGFNDARVLPMPNGDYLLVDGNQNRLMRVDAEVRVLESVSLAGVTELEALPDGTLLAVCGGPEGRVAEIAGTGRVLQETLARSWMTRAHSCLWLVRIGLDRPRPDNWNLDTVGFRVDGLQDPAVDVRRWSARALGDFGPKAAAAIGPLVDALSDPDSEVRQRSGAALAAIGVDALGPLRQALRAVRRPGEEVRVEAARALAQFGESAAPAVPDLTAALADPRSGAELRRASADALGRIGTAATAAIPDLLILLQNRGGQPEVRVAAALALGQIGRASPAVVSGLSAVLGEEVREVRLAAVNALGQLGPPAAASLPALMALLRPTPNQPAEDDLRALAADTVGRMGEAAAPAVPLLAEIARDVQQTSNLRLACLNALARLNATARPALPALAEIVRQPELPASLALQAVGVLANQGADGVPALLGAVKEGKRTTRRWAIVALGNLGVVGQPALPALREAARDMDPTISSSATRAIERIEEAGREK
jgi:HEAT repeat protein